MEILIAEPDKANDEVEEHLMNESGASNSEGFYTTRRHSTAIRFLYRVILDPTVATGNVPLLHGSGLGARATF